MRITEGQLRKIIRQEARRLSGSTIMQGSLVQSIVNTINGLPQDSAVDAKNYVINWYNDSSGDEALTFEEAIEGMKAEQGSVFFRALQDFANDDFPSWVDEELEFM